MSHTKTPWDADRATTIYLHHAPEDALVMTEIAEKVEPYEDFNTVGYIFSEKDASFIVRAVNSFEAMREALEHMTEALGYWMNIEHEDAEHRTFDEEALSKAQHALTLAGGKD